LTDRKNHPPAERLTTCQRTKRLFFRVCPRMWLKPRNSNVSHGTGRTGRAVWAAGNRQRFKPCSESRASVQRIIDAEANDKANRVKARLEHRTQGPDRMALTTQSRFSGCLSTEERAAKPSVLAPFEFHQFAEWSNAFGATDASRPSVNRSVLHDGSRDNGWSCFGGGRLCVGRACNTNHAGSGNGNENLLHDVWSSIEFEMIESGFASACLATGSSELGNPTASVYSIRIATASADWCKLLSMRAKRRGATASRNYPEQVFRLCRFDKG
jgi:hypothetical protein